MNTDVMVSAESKPTIHPDRIVRMKEMMEITGLSRSTIYARSNPKSKSFDPKFPRAIKLGIASIGWSMNAIQAWLASLPQAHPLNEVKE